MKPVNSYILIKRIEAQTQTASGILLTNQGPSLRAKVIAVADDVTKVKVGNEVIVDWKQAAGITDSSLDDGTFVIKESAIILVWD